MSKSVEDQHKSLVLEAFETLFNKRDYAKALNYWSPSNPMFGNAFPG